MQEIKGFLLILKDWLINSINYFTTKHTILCPKCYKAWYQFRKYRVGQNTLCKDCRKENLKNKCRLFYL